MDDLPCPHRSAAIGTVQCGCGGERKVYRCDHAAAGPLVTRHAAQPKRKAVRLFARLPDGSRMIRLESLRLPCCALCPHRPGAPQELAEILHREQTKSPAAPASEQACLEEARAAICGPCPRLDAKGQGFTCAGPAVPACPLDLWPIVLPDHGSGHGGGCCG